MPNQRKSSDDPKFGLFDFLSALASKSPGATVVVAVALIVALGTLGWSCTHRHLKIEKLEWGE